MILFQGCFFIIDLFLAINVDYLLDDVTGLVGICLVTESDESSDDFSNNLSKDDEGEESEKNSIVLCAIRTRSCSLIASL